MRRSPAAFYRIQALCQGKFPSDLSPVTTERFFAYVFVTTCNVRQFAGCSADTRHCEPLAAPLLQLLAFGPPILAALGSRAKIQDGRYARSSHVSRLRQARSGPAITSSNPRPFKGLPSEHELVHIESGLTRGLEDKTFALLHPSNGSGQ